MFRSHRTTSLVEQLEPRQMLSGSSLLSELSQYAQNPLLLAAPSNYSVELAGGDQGDIFSFTGQNDGRLHVQASSGDVRLEILNSLGRRIKSAVGSASIRVKPGKVFYVKALADDAQGVELSFRNEPRDDYGNDTPDALDLMLGNRVSKARGGKINYAGDTDVFVFDATRTAPLTVSMLSNVRQGLDVQMSVYDGEGNLLMQSLAGEGQASALASLTMEAGERYYIVASGGEETTGRYRLVVQAPQDEHGNTADTATQLALRNMLASAAGRINYGEDVDFFSYTAPQSGTLVLSVNAASYGLDTMVRVYDAEGNIVGQDDDGGPGLSSRMLLSVEQDQTYHIEVYSYGLTTGLYRVGAQLEPLPSPDNDPSNPLPDIDSGVPADAQPGATVSARVVEVDGLTQLWVCGTNGNDVITISQIGQTIRVTSSAGAQNFSGAFDSVQVFAFAGNDVVRVDHTVAVTSMLYGDSGNDQLFAAGGAAYLYGGSGDDLLVSVGTSAQRLYGGAGLDSFWFDAADTVSDADAAETAANALHRIGEFYQPYTTNPSSGSYIPLTIAGQNFQDPVATASASGWRNYSDRALFVNGPQYNDIQQGAIGDCYYLAALAGVAATDPQAITQMIAPMGDGTYAVRFFDRGNEVYVRVDADLPISSYGLTYADLSPSGEIWVAIAEKAYAHFRSGRNSYSSLNGGWMAEPLTQITNRVSGTYWIGSSATTLYNYLRTSLEAGHPTTIGSNYNAASPVIGSHAYTVLSVETDANGQWVTVYNPWGVDGVSYDSNRNDGVLRLPINTVLANYSAVIINMA